MKKSLLTSLMLGFFLNTFSQNILISQLTASSVPNGLNINVKATSGTGSGYLSNSYTITGNVIDLTVCYWFDDTLPILYFDNDFFIPLTDAGNYTINVQIMLSTSQTVCDNYLITDTETISTSYLTTNTFEQKNENYITFPNPTNGKVNFNGNYLDIKQVNIFDYTGKQIRSIENISENSLDLSELNDGIYIINIKTEYKNFSQKIVVRK